MLTRLFILCNILAINAHAGVIIPYGLTAEDRKEVVRILGISSSTKMLTTPYPLGGYDGFEFGVSLEIIDTEPLAKMGCSPGVGACPNTGDGPHDFQLARFMVGKGLYNNLDLFLHFAPLTSTSNVSSYGGALRYAFFEAQFLPVSASAIVHVTHINVNDELDALTYGADLMFGVVTRDFSAYFGLGQVRAEGTFIGAAGGSGSKVDPADPEVDAYTKTVPTRVTQTHSFVGVSWQLARLFIAGEIDRYPDPVYSARIGLRF
jgi:hypothetical protein